MSNNPGIFDCIIVGAGPSGIVATKEIHEQGFENIQCIDEASSLGGNFIRSYDDLTLTTSTTISMFSDFWVGDGQQKKFWNKAEAVDYWKRYSQHFGIIDKFRFDTLVVSILRDKENIWHILLASKEEIRTKRVIVAVGSSNFKYLPDWHKELSSIEFLHSKDYRNADAYKGKNVLIVGGGESASDVALQVSKKAKKTWISLRSSCGWITPRYRGENPADFSTHRGLWGLPRKYGAKVSQAILEAEAALQHPVHDEVIKLNRMVTAKNGIWGIYGTKTTSLPEAIAYHQCKVISEVTEVLAEGKTLKTKDGETLEEVDVVIFCTGFVNLHSFFEGELAAVNPRQLYKHMFHPTYADSICWIGAARPNFGSQFPIMELQARYCSLIFKGIRKLPGTDEMAAIAEKDESKNLETFERSGERINALVDYYHYLDELATLIRCNPPMFKYLILYPKLWLRMNYGPTQSTQFRLAGPGKKRDLAHEIIRKLPVSNLTHVVKVGIKGRIRYGLRSILPF